MQQYFIEEVAKLNTCVSFNKEQKHHIKKVLRMKEKDIIKIVDGSGNPFLAYITFVGDSLSAYCYEALESKVEFPQITLIQGMIKKDKWDFLIQKTCELGVNRIIPLISSRTIVKVSEQDGNKIERYNKIALEACEQCKRESIVNVSAPIKFKDIIKHQKQLNIVAYEDTNFKAMPLKKVLSDHKDVESILYVIGSEGGLAIEEIELLVANGFHCVSLGERILRAETAAMSVIDITRYEFD